MGSLNIPQTQTVALVRSLGGEVEFKTDYPVPTPGRNEVLAQVLYTGVCQSGTYTVNWFNWHSRQDITSQQDPI
jgi:D-arabinose 1-dehydrogenase-like Zn-dependent alcohol dehydrogenase